jgi:hypothetical protein
MKLRMIGIQNDEELSNMLICMSWEPMENIVTLHCATYDGSYHNILEQGRTNPIL